MFWNFAFADNSFHKYNAEYFTFIRHDELFSLDVFLLFLQINNFTKRFPQRFRFSSSQHHSTTMSTTGKKICKKVSNDGVYIFYEMHNVINEWISRWSASSNVWKDGKRKRRINDVHDERRFTLDDSLTAVWSISQGATKQ